VTELTVPEVVTRTRLGARLARLPQTLAWLAVAVSVGISVNFIARFGIDVPNWDQWDFVPFLDRAARGSLTFSELASQHNEHRILFPRLIMLGLARLTRWDVRAEMWTGWSMVVLTLGVLLLELRRRDRPAGLTAWALVPAAWLLFSLRQWENWLCGWQLQIFLAVLGAAVALWALLVPSAVRIAAAVAAAGVCSSSFASGLGVWPAGAVVLLLTPLPLCRRVALVAGWGVTACLVLALYLRGFQQIGSHPSLGLALEHPLGTVGCLLTALGASLVQSLPLAVIVGALLLLAVAASLVQLASRPEGLARARFGLGLVAFSVGAAALIAVGRVGLQPPDWLGPAMPSRYTTLSLIGVYGIFRTAMEVEAKRLRWLLCSGLVLSVALSSVNELNTEFRNGAYIARQRREFRAVVLTLPEPSEAQLKGQYAAPEVMRERIRTLRALGLGPFRPPGP
jgi:hypothetical protein